MRAGAAVRRPCASAAQVNGKAGPLAAPLRVRALQQAQQCSQNDASGFIGGA